MLDDVLTSPFELILAQSFSFVSKGERPRDHGPQADQMVSSGDRPPRKSRNSMTPWMIWSPTGSLLGEHHLSLCVFASSVKELTDNLAKARASLTKRRRRRRARDLGLEAAWWAQLRELPLPRRVRPITSLNFRRAVPLPLYRSARRRQ
ncbi:hypothetical protein F2981_19380 (plasmid) [Sinorhizobium meliloti]|nr:hypothetical protein [Sinorhizobium meliloti]